MQHSWKGVRTIKLISATLSFLKYLALFPGGNLSGLARKVPLLISGGGGSSVHFNAFTASVLKDPGNKREACMASLERDSAPLHTKVLPRFCQNEPPLYITPIFLPSVQSQTTSSSSFYSAKAAKAASKRAQGHHLVSSNQWVSTACFCLSQMFRRR